MDGVFWCSAPAALRTGPCFQRHHFSPFGFDDGSCVHHRACSLTRCQRKSDEGSRWRVHGYPRLTRLTRDSSEQVVIFLMDREAMKTNEEELNSPQRGVSGDIYQTSAKLSGQTELMIKQIWRASLLISLAFMIEPLIVMTHPTTGCFSLQARASSISILVNIKAVRKQRIKAYFPPMVSLPSVTADF